MRRSAIGVAVLAVAGCHARSAGYANCRSSAECSSGQVCFADGCGDPGQNIAVEVVVNPANGHQAQDFLLSQIQPVEDLSLSAPSTLAGTIQRDLGNGSTQPYPNQVSFLILGQSAVIPGVERSYDATVVPNQGAYSVGVGTGNFTVTATPADVGIPPLTRTGVTVQPGAAAELNLLLPAPSSVAQLDGALLHSAALGPMPVPMQVQVLDPDTLKPLSQRAPVSPNGNFTVMASAPTHSHTFTVLQAMPADPSALAPSKVFSVPGGSSAPLEMGDYGATLNVSGRILVADGTPAAGATVYLAGAVPGGGLFRTASVQTDSGGAFSLQTLKSDPAGQFFLWAVPPAQSVAGLLRAPVHVAASGPLGDFTCPNKVMIQGSVQRPDGSPFARVRLVASPTQALPPRPLPSDGAEVTSDGSGHFQLWLDPALYRFDFTTDEALPRLSRYVTVSADAPEASLEPVPFSSGRTVTGTITALESGGDTKTAVAPYASVRFFRVPASGGTPSELLAQGAADANGHYSAILPTR